MTTGDNVTLNGFPGETQKHFARGAGQSQQSQE